MFFACFFSFTSTKRFPILGFLTDFVFDKLVITLSMIKGDNLQRDLFYNIFLITMYFENFLLISISESDDSERFLLVFLVSHV